MVSFTEHSIFILKLCIFLSIILYSDSSSTLIIDICSS